MRTIVALMLVSFALLSLDTFGDNPVPYASENCNATSLVVHRTTLAEAKCALKKRNIKLVSEVIIRNVRMSTYRFRSGYSEYTTLVFRDNLLVGIHPVTMV